jgi:hypothetical protein
VINQSSGSNKTIEILFRVLFTFHKSKLLFTSSSFFFEFGPASLQDQLPSHSYLAVAFKNAIPDGCWVLVIGAASFVGSHVVDEFLKKGYKVRATDYNISKPFWLAES